MPATRAKRLERYQRLMLRMPQVGFSCRVIVFSDEKLGPKFHIRLFRSSEQQGREEKWKIIGKTSAEKRRKQAAKKYGYAGRD